MTKKEVTDMLGRSGKMIRSMKGLDLKDEDFDLILQYTGKKATDSDLDQSRCDVLHECKRGD